VQIAGERLFFRANDGVHGDELWALLSTNTPPQGEAGGPYAGSEGEAILLNATLSDPDGDVVSAYWEADPAACSFDDPSRADASVSCGDNGVFTLTFTATDIWGVEAVDTATLTTTNAAPVVNSIRLVGVGSGNQVTIEAVFSDSGYLDTHTALIYWGDGSQSAGTVDALVGTVSGTHSYAAGGAYAVRVVVTDDDGASGELTREIETFFKLSLPLVKKQ
jgi:hypothetical protein